MNSSWKASISLCLWIFLLAGCTAQRSHVVKPEAIKDNANTLFKIGMVKVVVPGPVVVVPFSNALDEKIKVLKEIPIEAICDTLKTIYGINIDTSVGNSIHIVSELDPSSNRNTIAVPYFGNTKFTERSFVMSLFGLRQTVIKSESPSDAVDITYEIEQSPFTLTVTYWYSIVVRADDQEIVSHRGIVDKRTLPTNYLIVDSTALWEDFRVGAGSINERFARDVRK